jgi:hypothetical protein
MALSTWRTRSPGDRDEGGTPGDLAAHQDLVAGAAGGARCLHPHPAQDGQPLAPPAETLLAQAGLIDAVTGESPDADEPGQTSRTEDVIAADERLSDDQKAALIAVPRRRR